MKIRSIQVLRAVAALAVVWFHARIEYGHAFGAVGVDLFFVISGFIITKMARGRTPISFMADRVKRIYPLYFLCLIAMMLLVPIDKTVCASIASATVFPIGCSPYLTPAWTLSYEMLFYSLAALSIGRPILLPVMVVGTMVLAPPLSDRGSNWLLAEFLFGVLIAHLPLKERVGAVLLGVGIIALCLVPKHMGEVGEYASRAALWGLPAALVVYGCVSLERLFASRRWNGLVALGDASYSIYLVHYLLHRVAPLWWPIGIYAQVSVGYIVHLFIERPWMALERQARNRVTSVGGVKSLAVGEANSGHAPVQVVSRSASERTVLVGANQELSSRIAEVLGLRRARKHGAVDVEPER